MRKTPSVRVAGSAMALLSLPPLYDLAEIRLDPMKAVAALGVADRPLVDVRPMQPLGARMLGSDPTVVPHAELPALVQDGGVAMAAIVSVAWGLPRLGVRTGSARTVGVER